MRTPIRGTSFLLRNGVFTKSKHTILHYHIVHNLSRSLNIFLSLYFYSKPWIWHLHKYCITILKCLTFCKHCRNTIIYNHESSFQVFCVTEIASNAKALTQFDFFFVESHLSGCFWLLASTFWEGGKDLWRIFCQYVSAVWITSTLIGGRGTQTVITMIKFIWPFCTQKRWGC